MFELSWPKCWAEGDLGTSSRSTYGTSAELEESVADADRVRVADPIKATAPLSEFRDSESRSGTTSESNSVDGTALVVSVRSGRLGGVSVAAVPASEGCPRGLRDCARGGPDAGSGLFPSSRKTSVGGIPAGCEECGAVQDGPGCGVAGALACGVLEFRRWLATRAVAESAARAAAAAAASGSSAGAPGGGGRRGALPGAAANLSI